MAMELEANISRFMGEIEAAVGSAISSITLYGSAATGDHVPGRSDLNFLLVAERVDLALLDRLQSKMAAWAKRGIAAPLVVDRDFLVRSTDSYPLEILGMVASKRVLRGADPLEGLHPKAGDVRVQVEREAKSKELLLRRGYLESRGKDRALRSYLAATAPALEAILRGILFVEGGDWNKNGADLIRAGEGRLRLDLSALRGIREIRAARRKPDRTAAIALYGKALDLLAVLADRADRENDGEDA